MHCEYPHPFRARKTVPVRHEETGTFDGGRAASVVDAVYLAVRDIEGNVVVHSVGHRRPKLKLAEIVLRVLSRLQAQNRRYAGGR